MWTRLIKSNLNKKSNFELEADLRRDLLEKLDGNETRVNTIFQLLPESMQTRNYAYWLIKLNPNFPQDTQVVKKFIAMLESGMLKDKDINHYNTVEDLKNAIDNYTQEKNDKSRQTVENKIVPGSKMMLDDGEYQVVRVSTFNAAHALCNTSKSDYSSPWCIGYSKNYFYQYEPPYYMVFKEGNPYAVITNDRIWDEEDNDDNEHIYMELEPIVEKLHLNGVKRNMIKMDNEMFLAPQYASKTKRK